jgi:tetratricopeptide (TPR) repeat protein
VRAGVLPDLVRELTRDTRAVFCYETAVTCLDDRAIHAWVGNAMPEAQREAVRSHLDSCDGCRDLVASVLDGQWIGHAAGRYQLVELIGAGAMGEVYRAEDPELGRDIAIKILHAGGSQPRLLREAQAMAKLAHANVMRIYDVGTALDRVFLAMELVKGSTLRAWLATPRAQRDVIAALRQAGTGLAAAHAAELIHGDFKPDNVLVADDGRVLVTDFGLARLMTDEPVSGDPRRRPTETSSPATEGVTRTRGVAGTPAYMAPEQLDGAPATAASDQFSFCVTLFEALVGERPFKGGSVEALRAAQARLVVPSLPRGLARLLQRGLAVDPAARFGSMAELLEELEQPRRTQFLVGGGMLVAGVAAAVLVSRGSSGPACADGRDQLAGIWDAAARAKLTQAFTTANLPYGKTSLATSLKQLDRYADDWVANYAETCASTRAGAQSETLLDLRMQCLRRRKADLGSVVTTLATGDATVLRDAVGMASGLPSIAACADVASLRELQALPADPQARARIETLDAEIARCHALALAGRYPEATPCATAAAKAAGELGHNPAIAEAELTVGEIQLRLRHWPEAEAAYTRALLAAEAGRDTRMREHVLTGLLSIAGERAKFEEGHQRLAHANALLAGLDNDKELASNLALAAGVFSLREGKFEVAIEALTRCVALREQLFGKDDGRIADPLVPMAIAYTSRGKPDEAAKLLARAVELDRANRGDLHPAVGKTLHALAQIQVRMGKTDEALASQQRSYEILRAAYGDRHADVAQSIGAQAQIYLIAGRYADAIPAARKAAELMEQVAGPDHPDTAVALSTLAATLSRADDTDGALAANQRALAIRSKALGPDHLHTTQSQVSVAMGLRVKKRCEESLVLLDAARATRRKTLDADHPDVVRIEASMADCHVDLGNPDKAVPLLEHVLAIRDKTPRRTADDKVGYAMASFGLARALWPPTPAPWENHARATMLAKRAYAELTALKDKRVDGVVEWAAKRRITL